MLSVIWLINLYNPLVLLNFGDMFMKAKTAVSHFINFSKTFFHGTSSLSLR
jgi:hypothetical protein